MALMLSQWKEQSKLKLHDFENDEKILLVIFSYETLLA
jgi:hypothetical protein